MNKTFFRFAMMMAMAFVFGCNGINRSLQVVDGKVIDSGFTTVNGSISIGKNAEVRGSSRTINGRISVEDGSKVGGLATVNGSILLSEQVAVDGDLGSVNGSVTCGSGTEVDGDISTVNGTIDLAGTLVEGKLSTINGDVKLSGESRVKHDVVVGKNRGSNPSDTLEIQVLDGSVIEGDVVVKATERKVTVVLAEGGEVRGEIQGATVVRN